MKTYGRVEVQRHVILTLVLDGGADQFHEDENYSALYLIFKRLWIWFFAF
jgi:hypothetical protein